MKWKLKAGTSMSAPINITDDTLASLLVPVQCASLAPPASNSNGRRKQKVQILHLLTWFTHTHTDMILVYIWVGGWVEGQMDSIRLD